MLPSSAGAADRPPLPGPGQPFPAARIMNLTADPGFIPENGGGASIWFREGKETGCGSSSNDAERAGPLQAPALGQRDALLRG